MDIVATFITQAAPTFIVGTLLLLTWSYEKQGGRAALHWSGAFFCVFLGWLVIMLRGNSDDLFLTFVINFGFLFAPVLILTGVFVRMKKPIPKGIIAAFFVPYLLFQTWLSFAGQDLIYKVAAINFFLFATQWTAAYFVLQSKSGQLANRILAFGFVVVGFASAVRVAGIFATGQDFFSFTSDRGFAFSLLLTIVNITEGFTCLAALLIDKIDLVSKQALTDPLTACLNRRGFDEAANSAITKANRSKTDLVIIIADLDRFKKINDTFGHGVGDTTIKTFSNILANEIRAVDHLGRLGGEEFVILLWQTDIHGARDLVKRIQASMRQTHFSGLPDGYSVTSSFGATKIEAGEDDINCIIHRADLALYQAKENGRDQLQSITQEQEMSAQKSFDEMQAVSSV